jgi:uncharacterized protein YdhG (YjbR/CyaY superfamily)
MNEVDGYISNCPSDVRDRLTAIRNIVHEEAPQATERICMNMPTFDLNGKWFVHFAAFPNHIGFYPQPEGVTAFKDKLTGYKTSKGTIQFPISKPLPLDLIRDIVRYRATQSEGQAVKPAKPAQTKGAPAKKPRGYALSFAKVYPLLIAKAENKGRMKAEVDLIIFWLTGYDQDSMQRQIDNGVDLETFFNEAPQMNPNTSLIKGLVCGVRVEDIEDKTMQKIRWMDKLVDELAKGKSMEKILRKQESST